MATRPVCQPGVVLCGCVTARPSGRRRGWSRWRGNSIEKSAVAAQQCPRTRFPDGLAQQLRLGRAQRYTRHMTGNVYAVVRRSRCTCIAVPPWPHHPRLIRNDDPSRAASWGATRWRRCRWVCRSWAAFLIRAPGAAASPAQWKPIRGWPACGWSVKTCRRRPIGITLDPTAKEKFGLPVAERKKKLRRPPQRHRDARACL